MDDRQSPSPRSRLAVGAALAAVLTLSASPVWAADDGQGSLVGTFMQMFGMGGSNTAAPQINYRPRGPLVLPKTMNLPPPEKSAQASNPAWPKDPDVLAARRAEALARAPAQPVDQDSAMPFSQMEKDRVAADQTRNDPSFTCEFYDHECDPHRIWAQLSIKKGDPGAIQNGPRFVVGQEPPRKYLTEPPSGYMIPTKTVKRTWEAPVNREADDNANVYYMHQAGQHVSVDDPTD